MRTEMIDTSSDNRHYYFGLWRYCSYCSMFHNGKKKYCMHDIDYPKREYCRIYGGDERRGRYNRYERDREMEEEYQDSKENRNHTDDSYDEEYRHEKNRADYKYNPEKQTHVHEFEGSTKLAEFDEDVHNHRFSGVSNEVIKIPGSHIHKVWTRTDFFDHFHYIQCATGPAIYVDKEYDGDDESMLCEEPHIHFVTGATTKNDGHRHEFQLATLIESPLLPELDDHGE